MMWRLLRRGPLTGARLPLRARARTAKIKDKVENVDTANVGSEAVEDVEDSGISKKVDLAFTDVLSEGPPVEQLKDDEYPPWLWDLATRPLALDEMERIPYNQFSDEDKLKMFKLERRRRVKDQNESSKV